MMVSSRERGLAPQRQSPRQSLTSSIPTVTSPLLAAAAIQMAKLRHHFHARQQLSSRQLNLFAFTLTENSLTCVEIAHGIQRWPHVCQAKNLPAYIQMVKGPLPMGAACATRRILDVHWREDETRVPLQHSSPLPNRPASTRTASSRTCAGTAHAIDGRAAEIGSGGQSQSKATAANRSLPLMPRIAIFSGLSRLAILGSATP
mmetsp:Transcript_1019/g.2899  ORF Transcript_1019/g.2899 Transcript_1019/m.2899 type:complete len:203 (-) Transcript_1019:61-669(-)